MRDAAVDSPGKGLRVWDAGLGVNIIIQKTVAFLRTHTAEEFLSSNSIELNISMEKINHQLILTLLEIKIIIIFRES